MTQDPEQQELEAWFHRWDAAPSDVESSTRSVMSRTSGVEQRRSIWRRAFLRRGRASVTGSQGAHLRARGTMPALALMAWISVIVLGGALLSAQPPDLDAAIEPLPAADIAIAPSVERVVEGRMGLGVITTPFTFTIFDTEFKTAYGERREGPIFEMSDDRLMGTATTDVNLDDYRGSGIVGTVVHRIENERGAWQGRPYTVLSLTTGGPGEGPYVLVLDGEGDYAGLTAVLEATLHKAVAGEPGGYRMRGLILEGSLPPAPGDRSSP